MMARPPSSTLFPYPPLFRSGAPLNQTNCPGTPASFIVSASGTGLGYQWYKNNSPLSGQTSATLLLNNVSASDAATYSVVVSGSCGTALTNSATLTVNQPLLVSGVPLNQTNCPGTPASFNVSASGTGLANSATLTINQPLLVSGVPLNHSNDPATPDSFNLSPRGTRLIYQWYKNNSPLSGQTSATLLLNNVSASDAATYSVVVSGAC